MSPVVASVVVVAVVAVAVAVVAVVGAGVVVVLVARIKVVVLPLSLSPPPLLAAGLGTLALAGMLKVIFVGPMVATRVMHARRLPFPLLSKVVTSHFGRKLS